jgi:hypothetical protein
MASGIIRKFITGKLKLVKKKHKGGWVFNN